MSFEDQPHSNSDTEQLALRIRRAEQARAATERISAMRTIAQERQITSLRALKDDLAESVQSHARELEAALENEQLSKQQLIDRETNRVQQERVASWGNMATGMAHALNQPLGSLMLASEMAQEALESSEPDEAMEQLRQMTKMVKQISVLSNQLRNFSFRQNRRGPQEISLAEIVSDALLLSSNTLSKAGVTPQIPDTKGAPTVEVIKSDIDEALMELLRNAAEAFDDARSQAERVVEFRYRSSSDFAILWLGDNGPGLDPEKADDVMSPFISTKGADSHIGLGLNRAQELIERSGGHMTLDTTHKAGVAWEIALPRRWGIKEAG